MYDPVHPPASPFSLLYAYEPYQFPLLQKGEPSQHASPSPPHANGNAGARATQPPSAPLRAGRYRWKAWFVAHGQAHQNQCNPLVRTARTGQDLIYTTLAPTKLQKRTKTN